MKTTDQKLSAVARCFNELFLLSITANAMGNVTLENKIYSYMYEKREQKSTKTGIFYMVLIMAGDIKDYLRLL